MITLAGLAEKLTTATGRRFTVERLGGNVYGITDCWVTVTIDGGQQSVTGTADVLVCRFDTGEVLWTGRARSGITVTAAVVAVAG